MARQRVLRRPDRLDGARRRLAFLAARQPRDRERINATRIREDLQAHRARSAVVLGGGPLGLEAAYALQKVGLGVTVGTAAAERFSLLG